MFEFFGHGQYAGPFKKECPDSPTGMHCYHDDGRFVKVWGEPVYCGGRRCCHCGKSDPNYSDPNL